MSNFKIIGNPSPVVGVKQFYSINELFGNSTGTQFTQPQFQAPSNEQVKWNVWIIDKGSWRVAHGNEKTGATMDITFHQSSLTRKAIKLGVEVNGEKAFIDIEPKRAEQAKIVRVELLDSNLKKPARPFVYGDWIVARVYCVEMERFPLTVTLWEDDGGKTKQNTTNIPIQVKKGDILNGKADIAFFLNPSHAWLANAKLAPKDKNEGTTHEYYVTAEIFEKKSKRVPSLNTDVANPGYKPAPEPKKQTPAEKKGPSKKEEKKIAESENKVHDYNETKVSVKTKSIFDPVRETYNSLMTVDMDDWWEKDEKGVCVCKDYDLIWGNKVSCEFRKKVVEIAKRLDKDPNLLMAGMALETGKTFSPTVGKGSSYVGLIQFGDAAAESVGTTRNALLEMTALQQLDYVEKYLEKKKDKINTLTDFYLSILMPVDVGKGNDSTHVVFDNEYPLKYKDNGELTDLSKSRHFGYRQNPAFYYEGQIHKNIKITRNNGKKESYKELCDEKKIWFENGESKYDGAGTTYIWEIEKSISNFYEEGKKHKASVFGCNKEVSETKIPSVESGTWNVVITENYTGNKCLHIERTQIRKNCRRGNIKVYDHNKKHVLTISDCLLEGIKGEDRMKTSADAPFGTYQISSQPFIMGSSSGKSRTTYGKNPRLAFEPINGSGDEADKSNRSLIRIHGGRQEDENFKPRKKPALLRTEGCIRIWDDDAKEFYDWWVDFHRLNPKVKPGKLQIIK
jgi:hypothetical protein